MRGEDYTEAYLRERAVGAILANAMHASTTSESLWPPAVGCEAHGGACGNVADVDVYTRATNPQTVLTLLDVVAAARKVGSDASASDLADLRIAFNVLDRKPEK